MGKEHLNNPEYLRLKQEFDYLEKQYQEAKKEYEKINAEDDMVNGELLLMALLLDSKKEISKKEEEIKEIRDRLFDVNEKMQGFYRAKVQKDIEIQNHIREKLSNSNPVTKKLIKEENH